MELPIKAIIHHADEGGYTAEVPAFPGCITEADTLDELIRNLREAVEGWLLAKHDMATDPRFMSASREGDGLPADQPGEMITL